MEIIPGLISIFALLIAAWLASRFFRPGSWWEWFIIGFLAATAQIILGGIVLSGLGMLGSVYSWAGFTLFACLLLLSARIFGFRFPRPCRDSVLRNDPVTDRGFYRNLSLFEKIVLLPLLAATFFTGALNAGVVALTAPHNWDSMVFHLTRIAYWLQHGSYEYYPAHYWYQITHQKAHSLLSLYAFLVTARNENFTQAVQYTAYWISVLSVFGISLRLHLKRAPALFSALVFSLLIECLMQATTTQNDMLLTAYLGCTVYFLLSYFRVARIKYLILAGISIGLAVATKPPAVLLFPSIALIAVFAVFSGRGPVSDKIRNGLLGLAVAVAAIAVFALPTGYIHNYRAFGHPLGPPEVVSHHTFAARPPGEVVHYGTKNLLRYIYDFIALDGLPPVPLVLQAQSRLKAIPEGIFNMAGIQLEADVGDGVREGPFIYDKPPYSHTDYSYWGIFGFALLWPAVLLVLFGFARTAPGRLLAIGAVFFFLMQAYTGDYEPGRGRYFIQAGIFAAPLAGYVFTARNRFVRWYLVVIVALGCLSALTAVLFRYRSPLIGRDSIFRQTRLEQLLRDGPIFQEPIANFERMVPSEAVVAACLNPNSFEYPLFGHKLTRTVSPLNSFWSGLQPIPAGADYLLWADDFDEIFNRGEGDIHLGKDWWLRELR